MNVVVDVPEIRTERLILRAPRMADMDGFGAFLATDRARFVGGPVSDRPLIIRAFGHVAGLWLLRGYSWFVAEKKSVPGEGIGFFGLWFPTGWPEPEMCWSLWHGSDEGQGMATEAVRAVLPWSFEATGLGSFMSVVDAANHASRRVAQEVGASVDAAATLAANSPGSPFYSAEADHVVVYRHRRVA